MENHFWTMAIDRYFSSMRSTPRIAGPTLGSLIPKEEGRADLGCRMHRTGSANEVRPDNPSFKLQPAKLNPERCFFDTNLNQEKFPLNM